MRIPTFAGALLALIGLSLIYVGLHDWPGGTALALPAGATVPATTTGGGAGFG
jgi:hypothetical protein